MYLLGAEQVSVPVLGHPFGAGEVTFPRPAGAFGVARGIDVEHDTRDFRWDS
jgi:hypothetical protein